MEVVWPSLHHNLPPAIRRISALLIFNWSLLSSPLWPPTLWPSHEVHWSSLMAGFLLLFLILDDFLSALHPWIFCHKGRGRSPSVSGMGEKTDFLTFQLNCKNIQQIRQQCKQILAEVELGQRPRTCGHSRLIVMGFEIPQTESALVRVRNAIDVVISKKL